MSPEQKGWKDVPIGGTAWVPSTEYKTGDWRTYKPIWNNKKCVRCMTCHIYCPEGAVQHDEEKNIMVFNLEFCKGCGICANECPAKAIEMTIEGK